MTKMIAPICITSNVATGVAKIVALWCKLQINLNETEEVKM